MSNQRQTEYIAQQEAVEIARNVLIWLSAYDGLPVDIVRPEPMLTPGEPGMMLTVIQGNITRRYITGGHEADFQFGVAYRIQPKTPDERLKAVEDLNDLGIYCGSTLPDLGDKIKTIRCEVTSQGALFATHDGPDEDYQILMKLTYEVI